MSSLWDAPNQQVVRPDESPPWEEGTGGAGPRDAPPTLDEMTKAQLIDYADQHDITVDQAWAKSDIRAAIDEAGV